MQTPWNNMSHDVEWPKEEMPHEGEWPKEEMPQGGMSQYGASQDEIDPTLGTGEEHHIGQ